MRTQRRVSVPRGGFTIIEVMIAIAIILLLAGIVGLTLFKQQDEAKINITKIQMRSIESGLKEFRRIYGRWPMDEEGLAVLWDKEVLDPDADEAKWKKFLEKKVPTDVWGGEWGYRQVSENGDEDEFDLWSNGPDGEEGTDDDLTSWEGQSEDEFDLGPMDSGGPGGGGGGGGGGGRAGG